MEELQKTSFYIKLAWRFKDIKETVVRFLGAGVVCYLTYRAVKHLHIRRTVHNRSKALKQELEDTTAKIQKKIDSCGVSKDDLNRISGFSWDKLVSNLQTGKK